MVNMRASRDFETFLPRKSIGNQKLLLDTNFNERQKQNSNMGDNYFKIENLKIDPKDNKNSELT